MTTATPAKEKKMTTTRTTTAPLTLAVLDIDVEGDETFAHPSSMRLPDSFENERCYWIGADATVSCWMSADMEGLADVLSRWGWMARTGQRPAQIGLVVKPHATTIPRGPLQKHGFLFTEWQYAADAIMQEV